jgi:hypothetical protein
MSGNSLARHTVSSKVNSAVQQIALGVSLALHAAIGMWVEVRGKPFIESPPQADAWTGDGIEVDAPLDLTPPPSAGEIPVSRDEPSPSPATAPTTAAPEAAVVPVAPAQNRTPQRPMPAATATSPSTSRSEAATASSARDTSPGSTHDASGTPHAPAYGAQGLPVGVRHLPRAFARAVALANRADAAWRTLPPGVVGEASVALPVEENGSLGRLAFDDAREREQLLPAVRRLLDNTVLLLASGRFSLNAREPAGGVMRVRVRVEILEQSATADRDVDPNELNAIDYEPPQAGKPGHGAFLLNSGRRVICWVTLLG